MKLIADKPDAYGPFWVNFDLTIYFFAQNFSRNYECIFLISMVLDRNDIDFCDRCHVTS
jgi:hypothetical protein